MTAPSYGRIENDEIFKLTGKTPGTSPYPSINNACRHRKDLLNWGRQFIILQRAFKQKGLPTNPDEIRAWMKQQDGNDLDTLISTIGKELYQFTPKRNEEFIIGIRGFCSLNSITLPKYHREAPRTKGLPVPNKKQARKMLSFMQDKRHKLAAYLQAESGLAIGNVLDLKNKHIKEIKTRTRPVFIELEPEKYTGRHPEGLGFLSPTAEQLYEQLCKEGKIDRENPEAYLITNNKSEPLAYTTIRGVFKRATQDAQLDKNIQPTHCLVKYFNNALDTAGLSDTRQKIHNGHGNGVQDHYTNKDIELARKEYAEAYPFISIDDPTDPSLIKNIGAQEQEITNLKEQVAKLQEYYNTLLKQEKQTYSFNQQEKEKVLSQPTERDQLNEFLQTFDKKFNLPPPIRDWIVRMWEQLPPDLRFEMEKGELSAKTWTKLLKLQEQTKETNRSN